MNRQRIYGVFIRHSLGWKRNYDQWIELIYWPLLDLILWGLTTLWMIEAQKTDGKNEYLLLTMMTALVLWQVVWRANQEIGIGFLNEVWNRNVVNLFASPLTIGEWILGILLLATVKVCLALLVGAFGAYIFYALNIFQFGHLLIPYFLILILFGWTVGFLAVALILRFGRNIQHVAWTLCALFTPISAVYFPVASLPGWLQTLTHVVPTSYVFEGVRQVVVLHTLNFWNLLLGSILGGFYLIGAIWIFKCAFRYRLNQGLQGMD